MGCFSIPEPRTAAAVEDFAALLAATSVKLILEMFNDIKVQ